MASRPWACCTEPHYHRRFALTMTTIAPSRNVVQEQPLFAQKLSLAHPLHERTLFPEKPFWFGAGPLAGTMLPMPLPHRWQGSAFAAGVGGYLLPAGLLMLYAAHSQHISPTLVEAAAHPAAFPLPLVGAPASHDSAPVDVAARGERHATEEVRGELSHGHYHGCQEALGNGRPALVGVGPSPGVIPPMGFYCHQEGDHGVDRSAETAAAAGLPFATPAVGAAGHVVCPASAAVAPIPAKVPADPA